MEHDPKQTELRFEEPPTEGAASDFPALSIQRVKEMLREADVITSRHDGIHMLHSARACLVTLSWIARKQRRLEPWQSALAERTLEDMRQAARRGYFPREGNVRTEWRRQ